jgi:outer membrane protein TolC
MTTLYDRRLDRTIQAYQAGTVTTLAVERAARSAQSAYFAHLIGRLIARLRGVDTAIEPGRPVAKTA